MLNFKSFLSGLLLIVIVLSGYAQDLDAIKFAGLLNAEDARKHLSILASDKFEGRETGTKGAKLASKYLAKEFKKMGLNAPVGGSYFQKVGLSSSEFVVKDFKLNNREFQHRTHFFINKISGNKKIKAQAFVFAGFGISAGNYDDLRGVDVEGKVVMILNNGEPVKDGVSVITGTKTMSDWSKVSAKRIENLRAKKPAVILLVNPAIEAYLKGQKIHGFGPQISLKEVKVSAQNQADVIHLTNETANAFLESTGKTVDQLVRDINQSGNPVSQVIKTDFEVAYEQQSKDVKAVNVLGYLEGTDLKNELLVISAHYDHIGLNPDGPDKVFNGADDDGSGTTAVLELARAFSEAKKAGKASRRSILFLAVVGEEKGLLGSEWYSRHPVYPLTNTVTNLNIDMIGRVDPAHKDNPNYCYLIGSDKLSTDLHKISENANATYTKLNIDYKYNDPNDPERIYYRSDHYNFAKHGIPIVFYFNGVHEDYHKESDEISKINFDLLVKRSQLVFHTAWDIVNRDSRPVVDVKNDMPQSR